METITTKEEARQYAIYWQHRFAEAEMGTDWKEFCKWNEKLTTLAKKFDLIEEFEENGIL